MNEEIEAAKAQQKLALRWNALVTAIDITRDEKGPAPLDKILKAATDINDWVSGTPTGVVPN